MTVLGVFAGQTDEQSRPALDYPREDNHQMTHVGKQLGEYTLTQRIGSGGVAEIWMAERTRMGIRKTVAIKLLSSVARQDPNNREMFLKEARLSMLLSHSGIVQVFDADECEGECFIAMEWVDGVNLAQLCAALWETGEQLPVEVSTYIIGELLAALDYGHTLESQSEGAASIVHRDVSPQNVMLSTSGEVKLTDFGVARFATEETQGNFVKGKLRYMPPEQLRGQSRDPRVDLFAVGAIFHELLEGRRFRNTESHVQLIAMIEAGEVPPLSPERGVPAAIQQVLYGLLAPDQRRRIPDARTAICMLRQWRGYENASLELQGYVHRFKQLCHRRSGHEAHRSNAPATRRPEPVRVPAQSERAGPGDRERRWYPQRHFNMIAAPLIAVLGLTIGISSIAGALSPAPAPAPPSDEEPFWRAPAKLVALDSKPERPASLANEPPSTPAPEPAPEPQVEPEPPIEPTAPVEPEPLAEPEPEPEPEPELEPEPEVAPEPEPAEVHPPPPPPDQPAIERVRLKASVSGSLRSAYVKVGGRKLTLQPVQKTWLRVGTHTVWVRTSPSAPWKKIGRIKLSAGHRYELNLSKPGSFTLIEK